MKKILFVLSLALVSVFGFAACTSASTTAVSSSEPSAAESSASKASSSVTSQADTSASAVSAAAAADNTGSTSSVSNSSSGSIVANTVSVQGTSSITVSPTMADISIGVTTFNKNAKTAQHDNAKKMTEVYSALNRAGIPDNKIKTVTYNISPHYEYLDSTSKKTGYDVVNDIQVTVTDLGRVGTVLDVAVNQGVNISDSISFSITDRQYGEYYRKALKNAMADAKAKATVLAAAAGVSIGKPYQISEVSSGTSTVPVYYASASSVSEDKSVTTPISGGELTVKAEAAVLYRY